MKELTRKELRRTVSLKHIESACAYIRQQGDNARMAFGN